MANIPLYRKGKVVAFALVDDDDLPLVLPHRWRYWYTGSGYAARQIGSSRRGEKKLVMMHRLILDLDGNEVEADHINGNTLDNRRSNLRVVTHAQNMQNRPAHKNGQSSYRGVWWDKDSNRWRAEARLDGKKYCIGLFADEHEADRAIAAWRSQHMPYAVARASEEAVCA